MNMFTSNEDEIPIPTEMMKWKWMKKKIAKKPDDCLICGKFTNFKYYNVRSCNNKCRGCRLDKCLRLGMDPSRVNTENRRVFYSLEARRKKLMMDEKLNAISRYCHEWERECDQIEFLTKILNAHRRITDRCFDLPDSYLNKFNDLEDVLNGQENILSLADCYSPYFDPSSNDEILQIQKEVVEIGFGEMHPKIRKLHIVYHLLVVGILKAMPIFSELMLEDKEILIRELGHQINSLTNTYYSAEMGHKSVIGPKGLSTMNIYINIAKEVPRVLEMAKIVYVNPIEAFRRIPMVSREEFALLIAIYISNPAISGLSSDARELLYKEQCKYSQLLLKYCQQQAGNQAKGAQRYAECLQLIECAFQAVQYLEFLRTFIEMFLSRRHYLDDIPADEYVIKALMKDL